MLSLGKKIAVRPIERPTPIFHVLRSAWCFLQRDPSKEWKLLDGSMSTISTCNPRACRLEGSASPQIPGKCCTMFLKKPCDIPGWLQKFRPELVHEASFSPHIPLRLVRMHGIQQLKHVWMSEVEKSTLGGPNWSPSYHYPLWQFPTRPWGVAQSIPEASWLDVAPTETTPPASALLPPPFDCL